ncbi:hypothetical protein M3Y94_00325400 [Aphelenchoides besseyi]|nr:hypothetical protein M3Y94_00325400 [Aphelenchoides besseyi]
MELSNECRPATDWRVYCGCKKTNYCQQNGIVVVPLWIFFNFLLTNESGVISDQIAYSFGYFMNDKTWQPNVCKMIPNNLLPKIVSPGYELGFLKTNRMKCQRKDVRVYVSVGDLQASLFKVLKEKEAVLQISTSSQLIFLSPKLIPSTELPDSLLQTPYFNGKKLVVAASLNGGNVFELLIQKITNFYDELYDQRTERKCSENKIGDILNEFNSSAQPLRVLPLFYGERHLPYKGAIIDNLSASTTLSDLFGSTAVGIVKNLSEMMSEKYMRDFEVSRLRLLNRATHSIFRDEAKKSFPNSEIIVDEQSLLSAAYGSAVHALQQSMTSK